MGKKNFDVAIKSSFLNQSPKFMHYFSIKFENIYISILNNSLNDVLDAINTAIDKNSSVNTIGFEIKYLSPKNKIKDMDFYNLYECTVCHKQSPIFVLQGANYNKLCLCKRHLRKLYNHLNSINEVYNITIKPVGNYEVSVKD